MDPDQSVQTGLQHFLHDHLLVLLKVADCRSYINCELCYLRIRDDDRIIYGCKGCAFFLHECCDKAPRYVHSSLHPMHRLEFFQNTCVDLECDFCKRPILTLGYNSLGYECGRGCDFTLHVKCANGSIFEPKDHEHSFIILKPTLLFTCDACGIDEDSKCFSCLCYTCLLQVHPSCREELFPLSPGVRQIMHPHELKLCYSFEIGFDFTDDFCKICSRKMNNVLCLYQCKDAGCAYIAHASCANSNYLLTENIDQDQEVEPHKETETQVITHFSHPHSLILSDIPPIFEDQDPAATICYGCVRPVSVPFYTCDREQCGFFLHKQCFELPKTIQGPIHQHPLVLKDFLDLNVDNIFGGFTCEACGCRCNGFVYQCKDCAVTFDVGCASFGATLNHESHKCTLTLVSKYFNDGTHRCNACDSTFFTAAFRCEKCAFFLDLKCASFPKTVGHDCPTGTVWSIKPLKLTFDCIEHAGGQYYCDLCGETRGKDEWFYHCGDCHDSIHPQCLLGVGRFMYGKSYNLDGHCHTVRVVKKPKSHTFCDTCKKPCTDSLPLLFCPTCKVYFHGDFDCCGMSFTDERKPIKNYSCDWSSSPEKSEEEEEEDDNEDQELAEEQVLHFGHPHNLSLGKYDPESLRKEVCDGCVMPIISDPAFYTCADKKGKCNFFLHKECFELPEQIQHPFHSDHPLVLKSLLDLPGNEGYGFDCYACEKFCNGFAYTCLECEVFLDVRCSLLPDTRCSTMRNYSLIKSGIVYRAYNHFHNLITVIIEDVSDDKCQVCKENMENSRPGLYCATCNVKIHFKCCRQLRRV